MRSSWWRRASLGFGALALATSMGAACGGGSGGDKTPAPATSTATKPTATSAAATKPATTPTQSAGTAAATSASGQATTLGLIAKNTLWDKSDLKAKPGTVTMQMHNQDAGIPHNLHVYKGQHDTELGKTALEAGPVKQTLTLELTAGAYFFVCDLHPATMTGRLAVE